MNEFADRYGPWAVIAGASEGTGAAFAEALAAHGVDVVLVARREAALEELASRLPVSSRVVVLDLSDIDAGDRLAAATADLDVGLLVFNAGADDHSTPMLDQPLDDLRALVRRNCSTVLDACHQIGGRIVERGRGGVILVTSGAAWAGGGNIAAYGATKAFDLLLAEALWAEWRPRGVDVQALVLGARPTRPRCAACSPSAADRSASWPTPPTSSASRWSTSPRGRSGSAACPTRRAARRSERCRAATPWS